MSSLPFFAPLSGLCISSSLLLAAPTSQSQQNPTPGAAPSVLPVPTPAAQDPQRDARPRGLAETRANSVQVQPGPVSVPDGVQQTQSLHSQDPHHHGHTHASTDVRSSLGQDPTSTGTGVHSEGQFRLIDMSLDLIGSVGTSTAQNGVIQQLQGGHHDPKQRGFTLQQAELALAGAVDPYFRVDSHITSVIDPQGETIVELEEAYATSSSLPHRLQLKTGHYLTEFGRINPVHLHDWDWGDQPVVVSRFFGGDGLRAPGARMSWVMPTDTYTEAIFGMQNASGATVKSFLSNANVYGEEPIGGRAFQQRTVRALEDVLYTARLSQSRTPTEATVLQYGASALFGPNASGQSSDTLIYGTDFVFLWRPTSNDKGWPFFKVQGEWMARVFDAESQRDGNGDPAAPAATLRDQGGFLQALWGYRRGWSTGLRGEYATGSGGDYSYLQSGASDPTTYTRALDFDRTDRMRISPLLCYQPSEFTRIRLQYNYDESDHLSGDGEHSVWLTFQTLIGVHQPHR